MNKIIQNLLTKIPIKSKDEEDEAFQESVTIDLLGIILAGIGRTHGDNWPKEFVLGITINESHFNYLGKQENIINNFFMEKGWTITLKCLTPKTKSEENSTVLYACQVYVKRK
jgi:hypothetical protein